MEKTKAIEFFKRGQLKKALPTDPRIFFVEKQKAYANWNPHITFNNS